LSGYQSELLTNRTAIDVKGVEAADFLQGLITNDIHHLTTSGSGTDVISEEEEAGTTLRRSLYSLFLNTSGRVLFETLIIAGNDGDGERFLIDCDREVGKNLLKHLKMYKLRKKIDMKLMDEEYETWAVFNTERRPGFDTPFDNAQQLADDFRHLKVMGNAETFNIVDPRVKTLGFRILAPKSKDNLCYQLREMDGPETFSNLRHRVGVAAGVQRGILARRQLPQGLLHRPRIDGAHASHWRHTQTRYAARIRR